MIYACFHDIFITVTWLLLFLYYIYTRAGTSYLEVLVVKVAALLP